MRWTRVTAKALLAAGVIWLVLAAASAAHFVFQTAVAHSVADPALVFGGAAFSMVLLSLLGDVPRRADMRALGGRRIATAFGAGLLGLAFAPALVLANRFTDAPPGAVVAFWTTGVWGTLLVAASALSTRRPTRAAGALVALVGCMGVLGSWERPSSFSLLVRYPNQEMAFVVAGVAWVAFVAVTGGLAREHGARGVYPIAGLGGLAGALAWGLPASGWELAALIPDGTALPAVLSAALMAALAVHATNRWGAHLPGTAMLCVPVLATTLLAVEQATGTFGPRPIILEEAGWATVVVAAGVAVALAGERRPDGRGVRPLVLIGSLLAVASLLAAVYALLQPGVLVAVRGTRFSGAVFAAEFALAGFRTVGGWLALAAALLALAAWAERPARMTAALALTAGAVIGVAHSTLAFTPLHTWMPWVPVEIQQDFGTEYASIVFSRVSTAAQVVGIMGACAAMGLLLVWRSLSMRGADLPPASNAGGRDS